MLCKFLIACLIFYFLNFLIPSVRSNRIVTVNVNGNDLIATNVSRKNNLDKKSWVSEAERVL